MQDFPLGPLTLLSEAFALSGSRTPSSLPAIHGWGILEKQNHKAEILKFILDRKLKQEWEMIVMPRDNSEQLKWVDTTDSCLAVNIDI